MSTENCQLFDPELDRGRVMLRHVANKRTTTKARASLPDMLELRPGEGRGNVFTRHTLAKATKFGPLEAPLVTRQEVEDTNFLIKLDIEKCKRLENLDSSYIYYDTTDENVCNWLMFVQPAKVFAEQNLCAYQEDDFIYFVAIRDVPAGEELKVWYSPTYAKFMSVSVLTPTSGIVSVPKVSNGKRRPRKVKTSRRMQVYPNSMLSERDVRSVPPKKRGWRRAKDKRPENSSRSNGHTTGYPPESHSSTEWKRYICPICGKYFKHNSKLKVHSVIHSSQRNFLCYLCGATFKRKDKLREHEVKVHDTDKPPKIKRKLPANLNNFPFKCRECQVGFKRRGMLVNHLIKRHPGTQTSSIEELSQPLYRVVRDFICPYCEKVYKSSTKRKLHIQKLHPGRDLPASIKSIKDAISTGNSHNTITKGTLTTTPFHCNHCERQYSSKHKRDKHMREKHSEMSKDAHVERAPCNENVPEIYDVNHATFPPINQHEIVNNLTENSNSVSGHSTNPSMYEMNPLANTHPAQEFCQPDSRSQPLSSELTATDRDLLNQAMSELEPVATSTQPTPQYSAYQNTSSKESGYSRYNLGHKRMLLKSYEDSQNQLLAQTVPPSQPPPQPEKQLPYKARLLSNEWRNVTWQDQCAAATIIGIRQTPLPTEHGYPIMNPQQSLVSMLGPSPNESEILMSDARANVPDGAVLNDVNEFVNAYNTTDSASWIFQQPYENLADRYATN